MVSSMGYVAVSVGIVVLVVIILLAILGSIYLRKFAKKSQRPKEIKRLPSQYAYISPKDPPVFVIPSYATYQDVFEEGDESSQYSSVTDEMESEIKDNSSSESPKPVSTVLGIPTLSRPQFMRSVSDAPAGYTQELARRKYRRTLSTLGETIADRKTREKRRVSVTPFGKMQVSINYVTNKSLLVIQINGMYDLPQLRTSGVSTPYVRVLLLIGQDDKETRTNFMNLSTNRICAFDRISLEKAKESCLKFVVLDYDRFSRSEFVAEILVPLSELNLEEGETIMRKLDSHKINDENRELGRLSVSLCQDQRAGQLIVHIIKAEDLPSLKSEDLLDTYVRVSYYVEKKLVDKRKTKVVKRTTCPAFNEFFIFEMKAEELTNTRVKCQVFQSDFKLKTEKIGLIELGINSFGTEIRHWNEMMASPQKQIAQCHNLRA